MSNGTITQQHQNDVPPECVPEYLADARHAMKDHGVHAHIAATFLMTLFPFVSYDAEEDAGSDTGAVEDDDGWEDEDDDGDWEDESASVEAKEAFYTDLVKYIAYVLWYARLPEPVFFGALYLLQKRKHVNPAAPRVQGGAHALFIIAYIIANDILSDNGYKLNIWRQIGSHKFEVRELATLKLDFCFAMDWNLGIRQAPLEDFMRRLAKDMEKKGEKERRAG